MQSSANIEVGEGCGVPWSWAACSGAGVGGEAGGEHLAPLWRALAGLSAAEMATRAEDMRRLLTEHGVSCPGLMAGEWRDQPWELDLLPYVLPEREWEVLERGLEQRARLLNEVLRDLYSSQRLVRDGFLPAPLVFANPAYLRACQGMAVPGGQYLQIYAADLVRGVDGVWRVLGDRTQVPTGFGFALENRSILQRVLPEALRAVRPRSLDAYARVWREAVSKLALRASDNPTIAVFTPGARNEAYFEHAYLARRLGFTLVEGGDLTVRRGRVCIKTLEGLRPVDVLLRRTRDFMSDPLELRGDSLLGVPGLVEAARSGNVAVTNALGSGLVEGPGLLPFLPAICRHLLDEELELASVPTWWCGMLGEFREAERSVGNLDFRPACAPGMPPDRTLVADGSRGRGDWLREIEMRGHEYVAQLQMEGSPTAVWQGQGPALQPVALRAFVVADGGTYRAVPGGWARVFAVGQSIPAVLPLTGRCQDVWVMGGEESVPGDSPAVAAVAVGIDHGWSDLPSRAAENFFWMGRYTERLEQRLRIVRSGLGRVADEAAGVASARAEAFALLLAECRLLPVGSALSGVALQRELLRLLYEVGRNGGVRPLLDKIHQAAFSVRDRLSADTWRILNRLAPDARPRPGRLPLVHALEVLNRLILDLAAMSGMETENMTRGFGWRFLDVGRRFERAIGLSQLLAGLSRCPADAAGLLDAVLEIADSTMTYRRRHFSEPQMSGVLDLLVRDATNPRSIAFQLLALADHAAHLPDAANPAGTSELRARIAEISRLPRMPVAVRGAGSVEGAVGDTAERLQGLSVELGEVSDLLTHVYHSHVLPRLS